MTIIDNEGIFIRIKAFLNSSDLTDSPAARDLYGQYLEFNNRIVSRLTECDILLQKKQKIEALLLARQSPDLLEIIPKLLSPERKTLLLLAELYSWEALDEPLPEALAHLTLAIGEMDDFRPLLTEYRRIARTDQTRNKLILLRRICQLDKGNPEWESARIEVENLYLSDLIREAQQSIVDQRFSRTAEIYDELRTTKWLVAIPTIVMKKLEKVVESYRQSEKKKKAAVILEKINTAYAAFDFVALEDADLCWVTLCGKENYKPDENELRQYNEAHSYLAYEIEKREKEQTYQRLISTTMAKIDNADLLEEVERSYAELAAMDRPIPAYLTNRVNQYRSDVERARRAQIIVRTSKIIGAAAVIALILGGSGFWLSQYWIEKKQAGNLHFALVSGNIVRAKSILAEIEKKYPRLASRPEISKCRAQLLEMQAEAEKRQDELKQIFAELELLLKQPIPHRGTCEQKIARAEKLIVQENDKAKLDALREQFAETYQALTIKAQNQFYADLDRLKRLREQAMNRISAGDFDTAQAMLDEIGKIVAAIRDMELVEESWLNDNQDLLQSQDTLLALLREKKSQYMQKQALFQQLVKAKNLSSLENAIEALRKQSPPAKDSPEEKMYAQLLGEIQLMHSIADYQNGRMDSTAAAAEKCTVFLLHAQKEENEKQREAALKKLTDIFDALCKSVQKDRLLFVRLQGSKGPVDFYFMPQGLSMIRQRTRMKKPDGTPIEITEELGVFSVQIGDEIGSRSHTYGYCKLVIPQRWDITSLRNSIAPHQILVEKIFQRVNAPGEKDPYLIGLELLEMILSDPLCNPYWKMQLSLRILNIIAPLAPARDKSLAEFRKQLQDIKDKNSAVSNVLENKFVNDKIALFLQSFPLDTLKTKAKVYAAYQQFLKAFYLREYQYLGFVMMDGNKLICNQAELFKSSEGDVLAFTEDGTNCRQVGYFRNGDIQLEPQFREQLAGHVLFTAFPNDPLRDLTAILTQAGIAKNEIEYPAFWPVNQRDR